jgi:phosphoglycolate phosphatase
MFEQLRLPVPTPSELLAYVGPPILDSFRDLAGFSTTEAARALDVYRTHHLSTGLYDSTVYPGMTAVLATIDESPIPVSLATSKPETPATLILSHFEIAHHFDVITGASDDEVRSAKADVVEEALRRLSAIGADLSNPVMIGDREHDVEGAAEHGIPTIFVEWGYGSAAEQVGAIAVAREPEDLVELLLGERAAA